MKIEYRCAGFISVSSSGNGLLYPIFGRDGVNSPYVQEINSEGRIVDFIECLDSDFFRFYHYNHDIFKKVNDSALFGFFMGGHLCVHDYEELGQAIRLGRIDLDSTDLPSLTKLGLARIANVGGQRQIDLFRGYLDSCRLSKSSEHRMMRIESRLGKLQNSWWEEIYRFENCISKDAADIQNATADDLIRWLGDNPVSEDWKKVCQSLLRRVFLDERIDDLIVKFLNYSDDFADYDDASKAIVGRAVELYSESPNYQGDFEDIILDKIVDGTIFFLFSGLSRKVMLRFFPIIIQRREIEGDHLTIIDSLIDYLSENQIIPKLAGDIVNILVQQDLSQIYPDNSYFSGYCRIDRLVSVYEDNHIVRMFVKDTDAIEYLSTAISAGYGMPVGPEY